MKTKTHNHKDAASKQVERSLTPPPHFPHEETGAQEGKIAGERSRF